MQGGINTRFIVTALLVAVGLALVGGRIYWLQVVDRAQVLKQGYIDQSELRRMNGLLAAGRVSGAAPRER